MWQSETVIQFFREIMHTAYSFLLADGCRYDPTRNVNTPDPSSGMGTPSGDFTYVPVGCLRVRSWTHTTLTMGESVLTPSLGVRPIDGRDFPCLDSLGFSGQFTGFFTPFTVISHSRINGFKPS